ncbi:TPA: zinc-ribbon domain-containing protein [Pseudomonas aeruginosa]|nr:zinc-ribbon domain-containing protein [Pseudomonas aeruginosa]
MALIKCKECGAQVSNKAKACPSCGAKVPKSVGVIGWLFVIFIVLPIAWQFGTGIGSSGDAAQSRPSSPQSAATSPTKSPWERHEYKDPMSDEVTTMLTLQSKTSTLFDFPYRVAGGGIPEPYLPQKGQRPGRLP